VSTLKVSISQIKAARALLGWSQDDLAATSGISSSTVKRLEATDGEVGGRAGTREALVETLQSAGIEFLSGSSVGVRLRKDRSKS
jgi:transcriptional regulator with XRE-family HTH domain